jgi:hypothetical protein
MLKSENIKTKLLKVFCIELRNYTLEPMKRHFQRF